MKHPHSFQEICTHSSRPRPSSALLQHFPPHLLACVGAHHPMPVFCSLFLSYVTKKGWLGALSPTATTRQPSSQAGNIPWVFQLECLTVLTSPTQRYRLAEVCLCPWHCVTADPTPSSTADCHRLHRVCAIPRQDTHTPPPCAPG